MEPNIAFIIMFLKSTKNASNTLAFTYALDKNVFHVTNCLRQFLSLKQDGIPLQEYYFMLKGKWDLLNEHHPLATNISVLLKQCHDLLVNKFLSVLNESMLLFIHNHLYILLCLVCRTFACVLIISFTASSTTTTPPFPSKATPLMTSFGSHWVVPYLNGVMVEVMVPYLLVLIVGKRLPYPQVASDGCLFLDLPTYRAFFIISFVKHERYLNTMAPE